MKKLTLALALIILMTSMPFQAVYGAPVSANIIINNVPYLPQSPPQNINDRLLLPFREISEAIGAEVLWDASVRRILTTFGNRYSIMHIDSPTVTYGTFTTDARGEMVFGESRTRLMEDVMPQLISGITYIPLRAFAETLGAAVNWSAQTSTAFITAHPPTDTTGQNQADQTAPTAPDPPAAPTAPVRPANFGDFSNTSFFRIMSSSAVRNMYRDRNNNPFVVVLYDSSLESSKYTVPNIQDSAQNLEFRVYGVDMADSNNRAADNVWLWTYFRQAQFVDPTIYFVPSRDRVRELQAPTDFDALEDALRRFRSEADTGIAFGDFRNTNYFVNRTDAFIAREIDNRNEFILVIYDSTETDSGHYVPVIKAAAARRQIQVHGLDIDRHPNFHRNIDRLRDFRHFNELPVMVLVYANHNDMRIHPQPLNVDRAVLHIDEFIRDRASGVSGANAQFPDETRNNFFRNANIVNLRNLHNNNPNEEFLIFFYDSSIAGQRQLVESFATAADSASSSRIRRVYGVNRASTVYHQNHSSANYSWLGLPVVWDRSAPSLILVRRDNIQSYPGTLTAQRDMGQFISRMWQWLLQN